METKWIKQNSIDYVLKCEEKQKPWSYTKPKQEMSWFQKILSLTFQFWPHQSEHARRNKICTSIYPNITCLSPNLNNNEPSGVDVKKAIKTKKMIKFPLTMKRKFESRIFSTLVQKWVFLFHEGHLESKAHPKAVGYITY